MYKNILVAIDPSHGKDQRVLLELAEHLADEDTAKFTALAVVEPIPASVAAEAPENLAERSKTLTLAELHGVVGTRANVDCVVRHGRPGSVIVEYARTADVDCIVVGSHRPGLADLLLGSTAGAVVRHAPCSVHVMRRG